MSRPISYHAATEQFASFEEAQEFGEAQAKKVGNLFLGVRGVMLVEVSEILHINTSIPLREDLEGRQQKTKKCYFSPVWVSLDPPPTTPERID